MPLGPVVRTVNGPECAFCGLSNPDPKHLSTHNVELCASRPLTERSYVRKNLLIKHLRSHGVDDDSVLADQWRDTVDKKYFACGFCGSCYRLLREQSNHVDVEHYRFSEDICDWDSNKAIRGLLSQPGVYERWQTILAAYPRLQESFLRWDPALAKELHLMLELREMREMRAGVLSSAAIDQSGFAGLKMDTSQSMQIFQHQDVWSPLLSKSNQVAFTHGYTLPVTTSTLQSQQLAWKWNQLDSSNWDGIYGSRQVPQIASNTYESPTGKTYYHSGHPGQPQLSSNDGESFIQQQHPAHVPSIASASNTAQVWGGQIGTLHGPKFSERSRAVSPDITTNPHSRQVAKAREYPTQAHTRGFHPSLATESAPLSLSRSRPTSRASPLIQTISSSSPTERPTLAVQPPGREMKDNNGIDVKVGLNDMHCTRRDQNNRRRQRRPR